MDHNNIKQQLLTACREYVEQRLATATQAMQNAQEAANEESKSSAGDKYDTGRAMMQIEREKAAMQVVECYKLIQVLDQIDPATFHHKISLGSIVTTQRMKLFLAIGAGRIAVSGEDFLVVAPVSPIGKSLVGLKKGDQFTFNRMTDIVTGVW
jgi:transcription elongation GreA/GreB family factor